MVDGVYVHARTWTCLCICILFLLEFFRSLAHLLCEIRYYFLSRSLSYCQTSACNILQKRRNVTLNGFSSEIAFLNDTEREGGLFVS